MTELSIAPRFRGPPNSGNGGYVAGLLARNFVNHCVRVRLLRPPPLDHALVLRQALVEGGATGVGRRELRDDQALADEQLIAWAEPAHLELRAPPAIDYERALEVSRHFSGHTAHPFPHCFVCGTQRVRGDGMRIFAGPLNEMRAAAPWIPDSSLGDANGKVRTEFIWAALDCPGYFAAARDGRVLLLGEMTARIDRPVHVDESCTILAWRIAVSGRRHEVGTALYDDDGEPAALAHATWIEPKLLD
jgi:hypothetical protein